MVAKLHLGGEAHVRYPLQFFRQPLCGYDDLVVAPLGNVVIQLLCPGGVRSPIAQLYRYRNLGILLQGTFPLVPDDNHHHLGVILTEAAAGEWTLDAL